MSYETLAPQSNSLERNPYDALPEEFASEVLHITSMAVADWERDLKQRQREIPSEAAEARVAIDAWRERLSARRHEAAPRNLPTREDASWQLYLSGLEDIEADKIMRARNKELKLTAPDRLMTPSEIRTEDRRMDRALRRPWPQSPVVDIDETQEIIRVDVDEKLRQNTAEVRDSWAARDKVLSEEPTEFTDEQLQIMQKALGHQRLGLAFRRGARSVPDKEVRRGELSARRQLNALARQWVKSERRRVAESLEGDATEVRRKYAAPVVGALALLRLR